MFKTIALLKRRPGMSVEEFRTHYETRHRVIGEKYLKGHASRYLRRYLTPLPNPVTGDIPEPEYDVVLEVWYPDRPSRDATQRRLRQPEVAAEIARDEERLFDRGKSRFFVVDERESDLSG